MATPGDQNTKAELTVRCDGDDRDFVEDHDPALLKQVRLHCPPPIKGDLCTTPWGYEEAAYV